MGAEPLKDIHVCFSFKLDENPRQRERARQNELGEHYNEVTDPLKMVLSLASLETLATQPYQISFIRETRIEDHGQH
jgi:hypothetical protein